MKVDALLTAAPKGEVRRDVPFIKDTHRWDFFFPFGICSLIGRYSCSFFYNGPENCNAIISRSAELQVFWFAVLLIKDCMTLFVEFALVCFFLFLSVLHLSPRENEVFYDVVAIVDPLTREAQKISSLLTVSCSAFLYFSPLFFIIFWYRKNL